MQITQFFSVRIKKIKAALKEFKKMCTLLSHYFRRYLLPFDAKKNDLSSSVENIEEKTIKNTQLPWTKIFLKKSQCEISRSFIRPFLDFSRRSEIDLKKKSCGIKTFQLIKKPLPIKTRFLLMNALVISHLHYPATLLNGVLSILTL